MIEIIPAVMPQNFKDLQEKVSFVADHATTIQIDVMDGKFVKARSWPYIGDRGDFDQILEEAEGLPEWESVDFEADLMVDNPEQAVEEWIIAGAKRVIVHVESHHTMAEIIKAARGRAELGLALNPQTSTNVITEYLEDIQFVQFMGIDTIGVQGSELDESVIDKISAFHNAHPEVIISIDGGVTLENAQTLVEAGAHRLVSGSAIFHTNNPSQTLVEFKKLLKGIE